jgi:hypothetical protein
VTIRASMSMLSASPTSPPHRVEDNCVVAAVYIEAGEEPVLERKLESGVRFREDSATSLDAWTSPSSSARCGVITTSVIPRSLSALSKVFQFDSASLFCPAIPLEAAQLFLTSQSSSSLATSSEPSNGAAVVPGGTSRPLEEI